MAGFLKLKYSSWKILDYSINLKFKDDIRTQDKTTTVPLNQSQIKLGYFSKNELFQWIYLIKGWTFPRSIIIGSTCLRLNFYIFYFDEVQNMI